MTNLELFKSDVVTDPTDRYPASVIDHPIWPAFRQVIKLICYHRDATAENKPRHKFDFPAMHPLLVEMIPRFNVRCVVCKERINPVRQYKGSDTYYLAVSCSKAQDESCNHHAQVVDEYVRVEQDCLAHGVVPIHMGKE